MNKRHMLLIIFGLASHLLLACDACSSLGSGNIGFYNFHNQSFVRLAWQQADYHSATGYGQGSKDKFQSINLTLRWYFSDRFSVQLTQPWRINERIVNDQTETLAGLADTRFIGNVAIVKNVQIGTKSTLFWNIGAGIKLPTGKYDALLHDQNLPENFNLGNGSWGYLAESNVVLKRGDIGTVLGGSYQHNSKSKSRYQFGHQLNGQASLFWEKSISEDMTITPNVGLSFEHLMRDRYANENIVSGTGARATYYTFGFNAKKSNWLVGVSYAHPGAQRYSDYEVVANKRLNIQLTYIL